MSKTISSVHKTPVESKQFYDFNFNESLKRLNPKQKKAVNHIEGPVLVIAGPGSGKTEIIAARIGNLLSSKEVQIAPYNILCLTYTEAATVAMRQRLLSLIGPVAYRVNIYTFHAFCNEVIQRAPAHFGKNELQPISDLEKILLLQKMIDDLSLDNPLKRLKGDVYYDVGSLNNLFRKMKEESWTPKHIDDCIDKYIESLPQREEYIYKNSNSKAGYKKGDVKQNKIDIEVEKMEKLSAAANLFDTYQEMMTVANRYDYSDMILWVIKAFKENENLLRSYQEQFLYFLIDEYQDTNGSQNEVLQLLIDFWDNPNVFTVGDDDQSIYEFQGARMKNILDFYDKYKNDTNVIVLEDNYRSSQHILDFSKALIDNNKERLINQIPGLSKTLIAKNESVANAKNKPQIVSYYNIKHEEAGVVDQIFELMTNKVPLNEIAVIYYKHRQAEEIINMFERKGIPYNVVRKIDILQLPFINNLLNLFSYLQIEFQSPHKGEALLFEIMHYGFFGISAMDIARISSYASQKRKLHLRDIICDEPLLKKLKLDNPKPISDLSYNINRWIEEYTNLTLPMLFEKIITWGGVLKYALDSPDKIWMMQVLTTFFDFIKEECQKKPRISFRELLDITDQMAANNLPLEINKTLYEENGVNLTTAHSAKGCEYKYVFLIGCTKDIWDRKGRSTNYTLPDTLTYTHDENIIEAARRLFYVALTRAKEQLYVSYAKHSNNGNKIEKSLFIAEIQEKTNIKEIDIHLSDKQIIEFESLSLSESIAPSIELLDKSFIDSRLENYSLSITHLNSYLKCQLAFYFQYILRVPWAKHEAMAYGSAVHFALKELFSKVRNDPKQKFPSKKEFLQDFQLEMTRNKDSFTDKQYMHRVALGKQQLPLYYDKYVNTWNKIVVTEYTIRNIEIDGVPINGKLDKLEFNGYDVNVVDYKTGNPKYGLKKLNPPDDNDMNGGEYWRQIVFYQILMNYQKTKNWNMVSGEIDFIELYTKPNTTGKEFVKKKIVVTKEDIAFVKNQIITTYQNIMHHNFNTGCGDKDCKWCNFAKNHYVLEETASISQQELF